MTHVRVTAIHLGLAGMPESIDLRLSISAQTALATDFPITVSVVPRLSISDALHIARTYGRYAASEDVRSEIFDAITDVVNRFWEGGLAEAPGVSA